jgi:PAS domain S-box-containing protein
MSNESDLARRVAELEAEVARRRDAEGVPYRAVVEDMSELVVRWKPDGTRLFVNDAYCRLFGATRAQVIGTSFWPLITEEDRARVQERIATLSRERPVSMGRHRAVAPDGGLIWMEWVDRAVYGAEGALLELQSVGRDITERVRFEEQARRIAQGDAAARATAAIAHDLGGILQIIEGVVAMMELEPQDPTGIDGLKRATAAANRLLERLRSLSHGLVIAPHPLDLSERVDELKALLMEVAHSRVRLQYDLRPGCRIVGDSTQIDQVLLNLVRNSVEALVDGGVVVIETAARPACELPERQRPRKGEHCALLRVEDNGPGISEAVLSRVFDAHITTKPNGQGLGLATVKAIVEGHDGTIHLSSSPRGTLFELAFPRAEG